MMPTPVPTMNPRELRTWERRVQSNRLFPMVERRVWRCTKCGAETVAYVKRCPEHRDKGASFA